MQPVRSSLENTNTAIGARITSMKSEIDYSNRTEAELVEMFGRMDPRFAPAECARLGKLLTDLGYIVTEGDTGPGSAEPSAAKLRVLIGSPRPFECDVEFGQVAGLSSYLEQAHNDLGLVGSGTLRTDGVFVYLSSQVRSGRSLLLSRSQREAQLPTRRIVNVESQGRLVRFEYGADEAITLRLTDIATAAALVAVLPRARTTNFRPKIGENVEFEARLIARSPNTPATIGLVAVNTLVFLATLMGGAELFRPVGEMQIEWGSNFAPYTTDGEWWRLFTSMFIHFGLAHILFNMVALVTFGPLVERLYGSVMFLLLYLLTGILSGLTSVSWHPAVNSAGASGAIFGICGALVGAILRARTRFPSDLSRPFLHSTFLFLGWSLYAGFTYKGVDYAAHLGGLASGVILGLMAVPPSGSEKVRSCKSIQGLLLVASTASGLLIGGVLWAQHSAASLAGDGLFYRTVHWMSVREHSVNALLNSVLRHNNRDEVALDEVLEKNVIPFWRESADRLATIQLPRNSPNLPTLDFLQTISDRRVKAFRLLDEGLRSKDPDTIGKASQDLQQIDEIAKTGGTHRP